MKRHLITVTRILWGKPLHSVFVLLWIIARTWYICITKIAVKHILAVVVNVDGVFAALLTHIAFANYFLGDKKGKRKSVWSSCTITNLRRLHKIDSWRRLSVYALPICCISKYFECYEKQMRRARVNVAPGYMLTRKKTSIPEETRLALASVLGPFGTFAEIHSTHPGAWMHYSHPDSSG